MKLLWATLALTIAGNVLYHLSQKSIPVNVHPVVSIVASYLTAIVLSIALLIAFPLRDPLMTELKRLNWATIAVGLSIVAVEVGFLLAYRAGWRVSIASVTANVTVALILLPTGVLMFHEKLSPANVIGLLFCVAGLVLVAR